MSLAGKVCLVTGASRGIGRGIALQLGEAKATVYITGRTLKTQDGTPGSLQDTAQEIEERGGRCIPVQCDHSIDADIEQLFARINRENDGQLDVLVNNAYSAVTFITDNITKKFWEQPLEAWDIVNNVGLRNHFLCTTLAARMMVPRKQGLIVMVSSPGGLRYLFNVAYGIGKAALDRMAADCAHELKKHRVTCVSLWPGAVKTELMLSSMQSTPAESQRRKLNEAHFKEGGETVEFAGKCVVQLAADPNVISQTGRILFSGDLADQYGFTDIGGKMPWNIRRLWVLMFLSGFVKTSQFIPGFIKVPRWTFAVASSKF